MTAWLAAAPLMVGGSLAAVAITLVVESLVEAAAVSLTLMVKPVVTVVPGATWWAVGVNTRPSSAVVTAAAVPLTL